MSQLFFRLLHFIGGGEAASLGNNPKALYIYNYSNHPGISLADRCATACVAKFNLRPTVVNSLRSVQSLPMLLILLYSQRRTRPNHIDAPAER